MPQAVSRTFTFSRCDNFVPSFNKNRRKIKNVFQVEIEISIGQVNRFFFLRKDEEKKHPKGFSQIFTPTQ